MYLERCRSIQECEKCKSIAERISLLNKHFTSIIYQNISRSLFQDHILVFSFILCVGILRGRGQIDDRVWAFLLTGEAADGV